MNTELLNKQSPTEETGAALSPVEGKRPPIKRHGVQLIYDDGTISIAQRHEKFAVVHETNARWFVTDRSGAEAMKKFAVHNSKNVGDYLCNEAEAIFLENVISSELYDPAIDAPIDTPAVVCLSLTERCNLACSYCFYAATYENNKTALHISDVPEQDLLKFLSDLHRLNPQARVYLTGGEPFLNTNILKYFELIKRSCLYAGVVTNAMFLTDSNLMKMAEIGVDEIRISMDGVTKEVHEKTRPGTFEKLNAAIERLKSYQFNVVLSMTVTKNNQHEAKPLALFAKQMGFVVSYSHMVPTGRGAEHFELLPDYTELVKNLDEIEDATELSFLNREAAQGWRRHTCGLAGQSLYVDLRGETAPCNMLSKSDHKLGNVFESSLSDILHSQNANSSRSVVDDVRYCQNCHVRYVCGGPCRASSLYGVGAMNTRGPDCAFKYGEVIDGIFKYGLFILGPNSLA